MRSFLYHSLLLDCFKYCLIENKQAAISCRKTPPFNYRIYTSAYTIERDSFQAYRRFPLGTSQTTTSPLPLLPPLLASLVPSALHATLITIPLCPRSEARSLPSLASQSHTLPSSPPLPTCVP